MFENPAPAKYYFKKQIKKYVKLTIYECVEKQSMTIGCNNWMISLELNWVYDPSWMLQLSEFV